MHLHTHRSRLPLYFMFAAIVIGTRLMIVASYGNVTPVWDQWDAEIDRLYRPWVEGSLNWSDMFAAHNEHRVFVGRLLALSLFQVNGQVLNPIIEMVANAVLHTVSLLLLLYACFNMFPNARIKLALALFASLFFSIPFGVENILVNNSAMYFLFLFGMIFLIAITRRKEGELFWDFLVLSSGLLGCLSFASGAITLMAGIIFLGLQWILGVKRSRADLFMMVTLSIMIIVSILFTPTIPGHGHFKSRSLIDFVFSLLIMTGGGLFYLPSIVFMFRQIRRKPDKSDASWFLFALCLWIFGQMAVIAFGRGHSNVMTSRYRDLYAIGYMANLIAILVNMRDPGLRWNQWPLKTWLFSLCLVIGVFFPKIWKNLDMMRLEGNEYEAKVKSYLVSHDYRVFYGEEVKIPYPDPVRLKMLLDKSVVKKMLPAELYNNTTAFSSGEPDILHKVIFLIGSIIAGLGGGVFSYLIFPVSDRGCVCLDGDDALA